MFSKKQSDIIKYDNKNKPVITILEGAVRSGKTYIDIFLFLMLVKEFENKRVKFIMMGYTIPSLKANVLDDMSELFGIDTTLDKNNSFKIYGNTIRCFGSDKIDSFKRMKGFTSYGALSNESTLSHPNNINEMFKRCSGAGSRIFMDTNPDHPHHPIKTDFVDKSGEVLESGKVRIKSWHFILDDNEFLPSEYVENIKKTTPSGMWYDRDILGLWVASEGMIYKDFDIGYHVISDKDKPDKFDNYVAGVDWGYNHPGVIAVYGILDDVFYRLKEVVHREKNQDFWISVALKLQDKYRGIIFYGDPSRADTISAWIDKKININGAENSVFDGITCVAERFKNKLLFIIKEYNVNYLYEIFNYRWKDTQKEEPIKEQDDSMDSERYACYSYKIMGMRKIKATQNLWR